MYRIRLLLVVALSFLSVRELLADVIAFQIDPSRSQIAWSSFDLLYLGDVVPPNLYGTFQEQKPGSLTTRYSGTILADVDFDASTLRFPGGSTIDANISSAGNLIPTETGGEGPLNYAGNIATFSLQIRYLGLQDLTFDVQGATGPLLGAGPVFLFGAGQQSLSATSGQMNSFLGGDVWPFGDFDGSASFVGAPISNTGPNGTLAVLDEKLELVFPIRMSIDQVDENQSGARFHFTGQLVATASVPETSTFALAAAAITLVTLGRRFAVRRPA